MRTDLSGLTFYLVDVFAQEKYGGNQLAVVLNAGNLSTKEMQDIANEMHFSETTFIMSNQQSNGGYDVRIFTPSSEVPFAGHPTLGTGYVIRRFIEGGGGADVVLNLKVGRIPVSFQKDVLWMKQPSSVFGMTFKVDRLAKVLRLDVADFDERFPIVEVSTGLPFIIVPLKTLNAVQRAAVNVTLLRKMAADVHGGILIFCPQTVHEGNDLHVRVFVDLLGIPEDPATGSGNGCLAGYLSRYRYFGGDKVDARVEQGYEVRRPSLLLLRAENSGAQVEVGGRVFLVAEGKLA